VPPLALWLLALSSQNERLNAKRLISKSDAEP